MNQRMFELVEMLKSLPTGDNAQPFRFAADDSSLEITHLSDVAEHKFNQGNVASLLSLGMMVFVIKNFANSRNLQCSIQFASDFSKEDVWLQCSFKPSQIQLVSEDSDLLNYLEQRRTDRGFYKKEKVEFEQFNHIFQDKIKFKKSLSQDIYKLILGYETMMFHDMDAFRDIEAWVRYNKKEVESTKTGMSCPNMGLDPFNSILFKFFSKGFFLNYIIRPYFKFIMSFKVNILYRQSAGYGLCVTKDTSDAGVIAMGGEIIKAWLMFAKKGWTIQPISSPTLVSFIARNRNGKFLPDYLNNINFCRETFNHEFQTEGEVVWLFRFGKPMKGGEKHRTLRLNVGKLMYQKKMKPETARVSI